MSQLRPDHAVARRPLAAAAPAPVIRLDDPACEHRPTQLESLPGDLEAQLVEPAEGGQVRASEGSVRHVEVFRMGSVRTSIIGRPRRLSRDRRASPRYTLNCDEPLNPPVPASSQRPKTAVSSTELLPADDSAASLGRLPIPRPLPL